MSAPHERPAECQDGAEEYNMAFGVASIFVVAFVSALGFLAPTILRRTMQGVKAQIAITAASAAGTGVLLVVALEHILADAFKSLSSPCLPQAWLDAFPGSGAFAICAITIMLMCIMDYCMQGYYERKFESPAQQEAERAASAGPVKSASQRASSHRTSSVTGRTNLRAPSYLLDTDHLAEERAGSIGAHKDAEAAELALPGANNADDGHGHGSLPANASLELKRGAVMFVEASVCTHSIPVGLSLGMQSGNAFVSLFIAVIIHQLLEGMGVGAAVVEGQFRTPKLLLLCMGFMMTAPAGIAVGVGVHRVLSPNDPHLLIALGLVNGLAAGMLLYVAIEHMNALGNRGRWLRQQGLFAQLLVVACFCAGGAAMIIIGRWA